MSGEESLEMETRYCEEYRNNRRMARQGRR